MNFFQAIKICFSKYATFSGRASRAEFWWFFLFAWSINVIAGIIGSPRILSMKELGPIGTPISFLLFLPLLAVTVRRLHDVGCAGKWFIWLLIISALTLILIGTFADALFGYIGAFCLLFFAPIIFLILLRWLVKKGTIGPNRFSNASPQDYKETI